MPLVAIWIVGTVVCKLFTLHFVEDKHVLRLLFPEIFLQPIVRDELVQIPNRTCAHRHLRKCDTARRVVLAAPIHSTTVF